MIVRLFFGVFLAAAALSVPAAAAHATEELFRVLSQEESLSYQLPSGWIPRTTRVASAQNFDSGPNADKAVSGYMRTFKMPGQTAAEWAADEARAQSTQGALELRGPQAVKAGASTWQRVTWERDMTLAGEKKRVRGEQYYLKGRVTIVEAFFGGPEANWTPAVRKEIEKLLASIRLESPRAHAEYRPCEAADLPGVWETVSIAVRGASPQEPFFLPYQRFEFTGDGRMKHMVSARPFGPAEEKAWAKRAAATSYEAKKGGELSTRAEGAPDAVTAFCAAVVSDTPAAILEGLPPDAAARMPRKDDVLLAYLRGYGEPYAAKLLRKKDA
jgi:hypothetical protein